MSLTPTSKAHGQSSLRRIPIPGPPTLSSRLLWWAVKLLLPLLVRPPPVPPKGPQILVLPPPKLKGAIEAGEVEVSEWKEEGSGWVIPRLRVRGKSTRGGESTREGGGRRGAGARRTKRAALYFHGGAYTRGLAGVHWTWAQWLAGELGAEFYVVPYPLAPTNTGLEVCYV